MTKFKIIILGRGDSDKLERCLKSLKNQTYTNYDVCIIDDATWPKSMRDEGINAGIRYNYQEVAKKYCDKYSNWILKINDKRRYGALNHLQAVHLLNCKDEDVIVDLDADDYLFSEYSLEIVNDYYTKNTNKLSPYNEVNTDVWLTFGSYVRLSDHLIQPNTIEHKKYEVYKKNYDYVINTLRSIDGDYYIPTHHAKGSRTTAGNYALRTYKYFLWKNISSKDFMIKSAWY